MRPWTPEPLFGGETVFVLGNGPSLRAADLRQANPATTIAVNAAAELMPEAFVLFARDASWCFDNERLIRTWAGLRVTTSLLAARHLPMHYVTMERRDDFPPVGAAGIRYGCSSGHAAVALAIAMGAARIVLHGFDGRCVDGRSHWHDHYTEARADFLYQARFNPGWKGWAKAAADRGCEILNATPGSAITEFAAAT